MKFENELFEQGGNYMFENPTYNIALQTNLDLCTDGQDEAEY